MRIVSSVCTLAISMLLATGCDGGSNGGSGEVDGGVEATGGSSGSGGTSGSGGIAGTGGSATSGGVASTGGSATSGGSQASGGSSNASTGGDDTTGSLTPPLGTIDEGFGTSGKLRLTDFEIAKLGGVVPTTDSKFYLFAELPDGTKQVSRMDYSGALDSSFNSDGHSDSFVGTYNAFAVDGQGRAYYVKEQGNTSVVVSRLDTSGVLDSTWGVGGEVTLTSAALTGTGSWMDVFAAQGTRDGGLYLGGMVYGTPSNTWIVIKLDADGALDTTFNASGVWQDSSSYSAINSGLKLMHLAAGGDLYVAGQKDSADVVVTRLSSSGQDSAYGTTGYATFPAGVNVMALATDNSGRLLGVGSMNSSIGGHGAAFFVGRMTVDGELDGSFGNGGAVEVNFYDKGNTGTRSNYATDVLVQDDDSVVVSGHLDNSVSPEPDWIVFTRLSADGSLSEGFGMNATLDSMGTILIERVNPGTFGIGGSSDDSRRTAMVQTDDDGLLGVGITDESAAVADRVTLFAWD